MNMGNDLINDAECGVIGGLLLFTQEAVPQLEGLSADDFSREPYGVIFRTALQTVRTSQNADGAVILSQLQNRSGELAATAMRCMELFISMANFSSYVRIVRHESRKRRVRSRLEAVLLSGSDDPCTELESIVEEFREQGKSGMMQAVIQYADALYHPEQAKRFYTGLSGLDRTVGGLKAGTLSYVGARPSTGKTAFALNVLRTQLRAGNRCLLFSLEMSREQIFNRIAADLLNLSYDRIELGRLNAPEKDQVVQALGEIAEKGLLEVDEDVYTIEGITRRIAEYKPDFAAVDFIQLIRTAQRFQNRRNEVDYISSELKTAAKRYGCHIMCLSQISRAGMDAPKMSDLKESGALEQDGDYIFLLHRQYVLCKDDPSVKPEEAQVLLDKNKFGVTGMKCLRFDGEHQRFTEVERRYG